MGQIHPVARGPLLVDQRLDILENPNTTENTDFDYLISAKIQDHKLAGARLAVIRDAVALCYRQYGPNHAVKCRPIYIAYLKQVEYVGRARFNIPELHPELLETESNTEVVA